MKRVIIWGYKPHTHTHSYIHWSFFDGFKSLGYETYWFDDIFERRNTNTIMHNDYEKRESLNSLFFI